MAGPTAAARRLPAGGPRPRSAVPGRQRWEVPALAGNPGLAEALVHGLLRQPAVLEAVANPVTGRVLVRFRPESAGFDPGAAIRGLLRDEAAGGRPAAPAGTLARREPPLLRVLRVALPERRQLIEPPVLSAAGQSLSLLHGFTFVTMVSVAGGASPRFLEILGIVRMRARLAFLCGATLVLVVVNAGLQWYRKRRWQQLAEVSEHRLRSRLLASIQAQDLELFDRQGTARLARLVTTDTERIGELIRRAGDTGVEKAVVLLVSGVVIAVASPVIALILLLPLPLFLLSSRLVGRRAAASYKADSGASGHYAQALESSLAGIAEVKSFTAERQERLRLVEADQRQVTAAVESRSLSYLQARVNDGAVSTGFTLATAYSGLLLAECGITPGRYNLLIFLLPKLLSVPVESEEILRLYQQARNAAEEIAAVLDAAPRIRGGPRRLPAREVSGEVAFEAVTFGYHPGHRVLQGLSFRLRAGETLAIVGPTGSGKSTLLRLLLRLYDVEAGRILLDGIDVRELDLCDLRRAVALVSQDVYLFAGSVRDNVRFGRPEATDEEVLEALLHASALAMLDRLPGGLDAQVGERGSRLSGGERQRVAIARALLKGGPILALDEATSHLDYETEAAVQRSLRQSARGRSVLLIAHRLATVRHADRILVLEGGSVREQGRHEDLLAAGGLYASLWELQSGAAPAAGRLEVRVTWPGEE